MLTRRGCFASAALMVSGAWAGAATRDDEIVAALAGLEKARGGRLGVCVLDFASGRRIGYRAGERFPICSTYKFLAAAFALRRVDAGQDSLDRRVKYTKDQLVTYSPLTAKYAGAEGMTIAGLCEAAVTLSDNTAGNLLLASLGGPEGFTVMARALGDQMTRLDRVETALNEAAPGDVRDTTTPAAMAEDVASLVLGDRLSAASRERLAMWLVANTTGVKRLRAGAPEDWRVGDKTGSGGHGETNDIAVFWPPDRGPLVVTAYYAESTAPVEAREAVLAEVGRRTAGW
jgi:beta-lactamase class A